LRLRRLRFLNFEGILNMGIVQKVAQLEQNAASLARARAVLKCARLIARHKSWQAIEASEEFARSTDEVKKYVQANIAAEVITPLSGVDWTDNIETRTAVTAASTTSASAIAILQNYGNSLGTMFVGFGSVFDAFINGGAFRVQLDERYSIVTGGTTIAATINEAHVKPLGSFSLTSADMAQVKSIAFCVISDEVARTANPSAIETFNRELSKAVIHEVDAEFLRTLLASVSAQATAGGTFANFLTDLAFLQGAVDVGPNSQQFLITSTAKALLIGKLQTASGAWAFPQVGAQGGPLINGITVLTSDVASTTNNMLLAVPDQIAIAADPLELRASTQSTINLSTTPDSPTTASTVPVSLFQQGLIGLLAERRHATKPRARSVAAISF
jgi:hypothetical protein